MRVYACDFELIVLKHYDDMMCRNLKLLKANEKHLYRDTTVDKLKSALLGEGQL